MGLIGKTTITSDDVNNNNKIKLIYDTQTLATNYRLPNIIRSVTTIKKKEAYMWIKSRLTTKHFKTNYFDIKTKTII